VRCASLGHSGSLIHGKSRRCRLSHVISCVQSQLITWDIYIDHQSTDDQCALIISVAPAVPPVSVHQCQLSVLISASAHQCHINVVIIIISVIINATYQCLPVHINATYQCPSELPFSVTHQCQSVPCIGANQCHLSVLPISATYQCQSVPPISASQCHISVPYISAVFQCPSVMPVNAHQCHLPVPHSSVPISATYQCPSVQPISAHHCSLISTHQ
ncbi:unnamed protein product, partial [Staurois parvus]